MPELSAIGIVQKSVTIVDAGSQSQWRFYRAAIERHCGRCRVTSQFTGLSLSEAEAESAR